MLAHTLVLSSRGVSLPADPRATGSRLLLNVRAQSAPCPGLSGAPCPALCPGLLLAGRWDGGTGCVGSGARWHQVIQLPPVLRLLSKAGRAPHPRREDMGCPG